MREIGWASWQCDGAMVGTTGQNRRIEAFRLIPVGETDVVVHIKDVGDKEFKNINKDTILGTTGQNKRKGNGRHICTDRVTDTLHDICAEEKCIGYITKT